MAPPTFYNYWHAHNHNAMYMPPPTEENYPRVAFVTVRILQMIISVFQILVYIYYATHNDTNIKDFEPFLIVSCFALTIALATILYHLFRPHAMRNLSPYIMLCDTLLFFGNLATFILASLNLWNGDDCAYGEYVNGIGRVASQAQYNRCMVYRAAGWASLGAIVLWLVSTVMSWRVVKDVRTRRRHERNNNVGVEMR